MNNPNEALLNSKMDFLFSINENPMEIKYRDIYNTETRENISEYLYSLEEKYKIYDENEI